jgi:hypothetical protein
MKYIYLLLLILVLYYLFKNMYQKYSNQENFDPSLVPVSSIVTLAKVAQKLVDGGGTLTNPGNLQIGMPSAGANGNLTVTGDTTTNTLHVTNDATIGGKVIINSNDAGNNFNLASSGGYFRLQNAATGSDIVTVGHNGTDMYVPALFAGNTNITGTLNTSGLTTANGGLNVNGGSTVNGNVQINGSSTVTNGLSVTGGTTLNGNTSLNGVASFKTDTWHTDGQGNQRLHFGNNADNYYKSPNGWHSFRNAGDSSTMQIDPSGNVSIYGNLNVNGDISVPFGKTVNIGNVPINSGTYNGRNFIRFGGSGGSQMVYYIDSTHIFD